MGGSTLAQTVAKPPSASVVPRQPIVYKVVSVYKILGAGVEAPGLYAMEPKPDQLTLLMAVRLAGPRFTFLGTKSGVKLRVIEVLRAGAAPNVFRFHEDSTGAKLLDGYLIHKGDKICVF